MMGTPGTVVVVDTPRNDEVLSVCLSAGRVVCALSQAKQLEKRTQ